MEDEHNIKKSRSLKSCKATLQKKKACGKNNKKKISFLLTEMMILTHYSYGNQTDESDD